MSVVCPVERVRPERAVAAKADDGAQVAIVRTADGALHAVGHYDPYAEANVIARGIVGTATVAGEVRDVIQSPMYKQAFDLATGRCTSDPDVTLGVWDVAEEDGMIVLRNNRIAPSGVA
ncbi:MULTISPECIES: nitrite reductase small subunit NirD [Dermacoccus]|uniref:Nitrite reductase (NAD(P)H) small subunit n=3 Tax=Dermacoccus TaxID=57495 RepID=A0A417ZBX9_9MICO|nr:MULTISPECIES: nitrite reductase small subunit NirD [Dermacoccus]KLO63530.1 hypothetical protein AA983_01495 [Dermacoccus sp. PE3]QNK52806.1 nitrite reductase small subunit NirD [Dermacoccus sp. PAMC28757]RHW48147.1 nitrite reductase (NAD(P)H) small subunit [Dermacoccus abyssi]